jgi:hypothetical protein
MAAASSRAGPRTARRTPAHNSSAPRRLRVAASRDPHRHDPPPGGWSPAAEHFLAQRVEPGRPASPTVEELLARPAPTADDRIDGRALRADAPAAALRRLLNALARWPGLALGERATLLERLRARVHAAERLDRWHRTTRDRNGDAAHRRKLADRADRAAEAATAARVRTARPPCRPPRCRLLPRRVAHRPHRPRPRAAAGRGTCRAGPDEPEPEPDRRHGGLSPVRPSRCGGAGQARATGRPA